MSTGDPICPKHGIFRCRCWEINLGLHPIDQRELQLFQEVLRTGECSYCGTSIRPKAKLVIEFEQLYKDVRLPVCATSGSACLDAFAYIKGRTIACYSEKNQPYELAGSETELLRGDWSFPLYAGHRARVPFGFKARLPKGHEVQVRSRSGLAWKFNVAVCQGIGTIDEDYPDEWGVMLENRSSKTFRVEHDMRVCQLAVAPTHATLFVWEPGTVFRTTDRAGGFGSTGK